MATYIIDLTVPISNLEEFIESLRGVGAVESLQFSIEADSRRSAVSETVAVLEEFSATYRGCGIDTEARMGIEERLIRGEERPSTLI